LTVSGWFFCESKEEMRARGKNAKEPSNKKKKKKSIDSTRAAVKQWDVRPGCVLAKSV
jgi:hypothetical protein